jgi:predicted RNase H-like HicB family nuclease
MPGCITEGETKNELIANLREALAGYLLSESGTYQKEEGGIEEEIEF